MTGLHDLDLADVADTLRSRAVSSVEVTRHVLGRIDRLDGRLRSYATVTADLTLAGADAADVAIAAGRVRGALHGVPLARLRRFESPGCQGVAGTSSWAAHDRVSGPGELSPSAR